MTPPAPLECHPAWRDMAPSLFVYLDDPACWRFLMPKSPVLRLTLEPVPLVDQLDNMPEPFVFTIQRAFGFAPYVGRPFIYVWRVATDQLGRSIAGESTIQYLEEDWRTP